MNPRFATLLALLPACGAGLEPCDIRAPSCQDDVFYAVLDVRGDTWDAWAAPPAIWVLSADAYREQLEEVYATATDSYDLWDDAFTMVGLVDPDADLTTATIESRVTNTVAYYSPASRAVTIIDHGEPTRASRDTEILAHEFVHAIQDRYHGLEAVEGHARTSDEWFAARSMVEGEAVLYASMVMLGAAGRGFGSIDWDSMFDGWRDRMDEDVADSPARFTEARRRYVYPFGGQHMADAYRDGGNPEVQRWFYDTPPSGLHVLDGAGGLDPAVRALDCELSAPEGYELTGWDALGAIGALALLNDNYDYAGAWWAQAGHWRADHFQVFQSEAHMAVVWRLAWSSAARANAFVSALESRVLDWQLHVFGDQVVIVAASDATLLDAWDGTGCE